MEPSHTPSTRRELDMISREFRLCIKALKTRIEELSILASRDLGDDAVAFVPAEDGPHLQDIFIQLQRLCEITEELILVLHKKRSPTRIHESCTVATSHHPWTKTSKTQENRKSSQSLCSEQHPVDLGREQPSIHPITPITGQNAPLIGVHFFSPQKIPVVPHISISLHRVPSAGPVRETTITQSTIPGLLEPLDQYAHCKILIAEDNAIRQKVLFKYLGKLGIHNVVVAENGQIAMDKLQESMEILQPFDLIFMNGVMPVTGGREATRIIREMGYCGPICGMLANVMSDNKQRALDAGMSITLDMPFHFHSIRKVLEQYLVPIPSETEEVISPELVDNLPLPRRKPAVKSRL